MALTFSQGSLLAEDVYKKVTSLLTAFHHEGIPVGFSRAVNFVLPLWEPFAKSIIRGKQQDSVQIKGNTHSIDIQNKAFPESFDFIQRSGIKPKLALGAATNYPVDKAIYNTLIQQIKCMPSTYFLHTIKLP